ILAFVQKHFQKNWVYEVEHALMESVSKCFIATEGGKILGFACFDSSAKGFFGPIGVDPTRRGEDIGKMLLIKTLESMREYGYGYAIIGWVSEAEQFYRKAVGAEYIKDGNPENSVYSNLIFMD
ncbi:MAG: GNAT family N-acetyltransferase, partial [Lachnospiraceae bacterium]|nr:GNAT family N-acetyltransferase [Lachnospiraceae bacterium]